MRKTLRIFFLIWLILGIWSQVRAAQSEAAPPKLKRIRPSTITAGAPTFTLRLEGKNFAPGAKVLFDGVELSSPRVVERNRVILVDVDASLVAAPGEHTIQAINPDGQSTVARNLSVIEAREGLTMQLVVRTASEDPSQSISVDIIGSGFTDNSKVLFWGVEVQNTTFVSETKLSFLLPLGLMSDTARVPVMVQNRSGRLSNVDIFFVLPRPAVITELDPDTIQVGSEDFALKVFAENIKPDARIVINGNPLETSRPKEGRLETTVPASFRSAPGQLIVRIEQEGLQSSDFVLSVTPTEGPFIFTIAPNRIRQGEKKETLDLVGANFRGEVKVLINGQEQRVRSSSRRRIIARVSDEITATLGTYTVQVQDADGNLSNVAAFEVVPDVNVSTLAGGNRDGFNQGCVAADQAFFRRPSRMAFGQDGLIYVVDHQNHAIRTVDPITGQTCTLAGTGSAAYNDSGNPRESEPDFKPAFSYPLGVAVRRDGTIYVTENGNHVIRRISRGPSGAITIDTFAGTFVDITNKDRQDRFKSTREGLSGFRDGGAFEAAFRQPDDIVIAPQGTIYLSDAGNNVIRRIRQVGSDLVVETVAGNGLPGFADGQAANARFNTPTGIALTPDGQFLIVADTNNHRIRRINLATGRVDTLSGSGEIGGIDGPPGEASFDQPIGVAIDSDGTVYVSEYRASRIRRVDPAGNVTTLTGGARSKFRDGPGLQALFNAPRGILLDRANKALYVADFENSKIRKIALP
jgi:DNA-binding beta-propeller fold protein YncE